MKELKPCPFCGSTDIKIDRAFERFNTHQVRCRECHVRIAKKGEDITIKAWNTRQELPVQVWDIHKQKYIPKEVYLLFSKRTDFNAFGIMTKDWEDYKDGE